MLTMLVTLVLRRAGLINSSRSCLRRTDDVKTTIKSVRMEKFEGQFTGKLVVSIADEVTGFIRNVDSDGVVSFEQAQLPQIKMAIGAFLAQCRQVVDDKFVTAFGYRLDAAKVGGIEELVSALNVILNGATIEIDSELKEADKDMEDSHDAIFYKIQSLKLTEMMSYLVAQYFVENFMKVADMTRQQIFIKQLFGIKL